MSNLTRGIALFLTLLILVLFACAKEEMPMQKNGNAQDQREDIIPCDQALRIARLDAEKAYRDLSMYRIVLTLEKDGWHVDYELRDRVSEGGGPHYVIDSKTGNILSKRYEQ
jgi:uncharacterized membrane protein YkoI